jgi:hypothetical protein
VLALGEPLSSDECSGITLTHTDVVTSGCAGTFSVERIWIAKDACGNETSCVQSIAVQDTTPPQIICPPYVELQIPADTTTQTNGYASGIDQCSSVSISHRDSVVMITPNTYNVFRRWHAEDACGNFSECCQPMAVKDTIPPVLSCPSDTTVSCPADTSIAILGVSTATDALGCALVITHRDSVSQGCGNNLTILRIWEASDPSGNRSECTQLIQVVDTTPPVLLCPADVVLDCPADTSVASHGTATATEECSWLIITHSDQVTYGCGNSFTVERTWRATDDCGNYSECVQTLAVQDTTDPIITCPQDVVLDCPADTTVATHGTATATDECSNLSITHQDQVTYVCGNAFVVARTWRATDDCGNYSECVQSLTVQDTTPPVISCPNDTVTTADYGSCEDYVSLGQPQAWDECSDWSYVNDFTGTADASGIYPAGTTLVTWTLTDDCGNASSCVQTIVVRNYPLATDDDTIVPTGAIVAFPVLGNDYDCQGLIDEGCVSIYSQPTNGTLSVDPITGVVTYVPYQGLINYSDTFDYIMCNEFGLRDTATAVITYNTPPTATITGGGVMCKYSSSYFTVHLTGTGPWDFALFDGTQTTVYTGVTQPWWNKFVSPLVTTTYSILWVRDATTIQVAGTGTATVVVNNPAQFIITGGGIFNQGDPGVVIGLSGSQTGVAYQLLLNSIPLGLPLAGTGAPLSFGYQTQAGIYTVRATDTLAFCSEYMLGSAPVQMNPQPVRCLVTGGGICCMGCYDLEIGLECSELGVNYELYRNGQPTGRVLAGTGNPLAWGHLMQPGLYTVRGTNVSTGAWVDMSGSALVQFYPLPQAVLTGSATIIQGQSTLLTVHLTGTPPFRFALREGVNTTVYDNVNTYLWTLGVSPQDTTVYYVAWVMDSTTCGDMGYGEATVNVIHQKYGAILGSIAYANTGQSPLSGVSIQLRNAQDSAIATTTSDAAGNYAFSQLSPGTYSIVPTGLPVAGGVNATDALLATQAFTYGVALSPIAMKAADVNASQYVNASDGLMIAQHFVTPGSTFPSGNWAFLCPQATIPADGSSQLADIQALCYGDVNASWDPTKSLQWVSPGKQGRILLTDMGVFELPVYAQGSLSLGALSLEIDYPEQLLSVVDVRLNTPDKAPFDLKIEEGRLRLAWFDVTPWHIAQGEPLAMLRLSPSPQAFRQGGVIPLRISSETELADEYGHTIPTPLSAPVIELIASELALAVVPNPLSAQGEIRFSLPESGRISLEVYNALGQRIGILLNEAQAAGSHQLNWDASGYAPGVYTLRLQSENEVRSVRVVKE